MKRRRRRKKRYHTGVHESPKSSGPCRYRSGWELLLMQHMDVDPAVSSYLYEGLAIPYVSNLRTGKLRSYYPDFLVTMADGSRRLVEVKPSRKLAHATVRKKLSAAQQWCSDHTCSLEVVTEHVLKAMGLL